ncbi:hypothetical protein A6V39_00500 [Candidatus Mycoplasma haematobovis]|uniref:Uncharacterized protein n=1 Tax=Candidatus Mycoplasma haematobovis TaxID=432608 RepID=A0A1A9QFQ5_9MOLU|nr:hypothetical protein [Candidatus Mycoplasma haematobovis]OAL10530.1 hypothetical protein A6V39_00500 [Candidatus Mycoplasma haematobovis]
MTTKFIVSTALGVSAIGGTAGIGYWYSLPKDLKELLIKEGIKLLDVDSTKDDDNWKKLAEKYKGEGESITLTDNTVIKRIKDFKIADPAPNNAIDYTKLKDKCKKLFQKPIEKEEAFDTAKQNAKDWCSSDSDVFKKDLAPASRGSSVGNVNPGSVGSGDDRGGVGG